MVSTEECYDEVVWELLQEVNLNFNVSMEHGICIVLSKAPRMRLKTLNLSFLFTESNERHCQLWWRHSLSTIDETEENWAHRIIYTSLFEVLPDTHIFNCGFTNVYKFQFKNLVPNNIFTNVIKLLCSLANAIVYADHLGFTKWFLLSNMAWTKGLNPWYPLCNR